MVVGGVQLFSCQAQLMLCYIKLDPNIICLIVSILQCDLFFQYHKTRQYYDTKKFQEALTREQVRDAAFEGRAGTSGIRYYGVKNKVNYNLL